MAASPTQIHWALPSKLNLSYDELFEHALKIIKRSRDLTHKMMEDKFIEDAPID